LIPWQIQPLSGLACFLFINNEDLLFASGVENLFRGTIMILLLDTKGRVRGHDPLIVRLQDLVPEGDLKVFHALDNLFDEILQSLDEMFIVVLRPMNQTDLEDFKRLRGLLRNLRIVLILPDNDRQTLALGHDLRPRYLVSDQNAFDDIAAVLGKMMHNHQRKSLGLADEPPTCRPMQDSAGAPQLPNHYPSARARMQKIIGCRWDLAHCYGRRFSRAWHGTC
jgi:hypothetical protein